jgi:hypothetical protein
MVYTMNGEPTTTSSIINPTPKVKAPVYNKIPIMRVQLGKVHDNTNLPNTVLQKKKLQTNCVNCGETI